MGPIDELYEEGLAIAEAMGLPVEDELVWEEDPDCPPGMVYFLNPRQIHREPVAPDWMDEYLRIGNERHWN